MPISVFCQYFSSNIPNDSQPKFWDIQNVIFYILFIYFS